MVLTVLLTEGLIKTSKSGYLYLQFNYFTIIVDKKLKRLKINVLSNGFFVET